MDVYQIDNLSRSIITLLRDPFFQIPVGSFIDENCDVAVNSFSGEEFTLDERDSPEFRRIHEEYKHLVPALLEAYRDDHQFPESDFLAALGNVISKCESEYKEWSSDIDYVVAVEDFGTFVRIMYMRNLKLQEQAILMLLASNGRLPPSFDLSALGKMEGLSEEALVAIALRKSQEEYEEEQRSLAAEKEEEAARKTAVPRPPSASGRPPNASGRPPSASGRGGDSVHSFPATKAATAAAAAHYTASRDKRPTEREPSPPPYGSTQPTPLPGPAEIERKDLLEMVRQQKQQAAALQEELSRIDISGDRENESTSSPPGTQLLNEALRQTSIPGDLNPVRRPSSSADSRSALEEMRRRQELIREQREKLRQVKQEERANLLRARNPAASAAASLDATGLGGGLIGRLSLDDGREDRGSRRPSEPTAIARPVSARVAKKTVAAAGRNVPRLEDEKELAIRRAIARRLRSEVLTKDDEDQ